MKFELLTSTCTFMLKRYNIIVDEIMLLFSCDLRGARGCNSDRFHQEFAMERKPLRGEESGAVTLP